MRVTRILALAAAAIVALLAIPSTASAAPPTNSGDGGVTVSVRVVDGISLTRDDDGQFVGRYVGKSGSVVTTEFMVDGVLTIITTAL